MSSCDLCHRKATTRLATADGQLLLCNRCHRLQRLSDQLLSEPGMEPPTLVLREQNTLHPTDRSDAQYQGEPAPDWLEEIYLELLEEEVTEIPEWLADAEYFSHH